MSIAPGGVTAYPISLVDTITGETVVLQDPDGDAADALPVVVTSLQVGGADIRDVVANRSNDDGTIDTTQYAGAAAVTCALTCLPGLTAHQVEDTLRGWLRPNRRAWLTVQRQGWDQPRRLLVRADALSPPVSSPGPTVAMQLAWRAINGVWESVAEQSKTLYPGMSADVGRTYPRTYPWSYTPSIPTGAGLVTVGGNVATPPMLRIYGPVTAPGIANTTTGKAFQFISSYAVPAGEYVTVDCGNRTVRANDDPTISRENVVDWSNSTYWKLQPGDNQLAFTGSHLGAVTQAVAAWYERTA
jgi:hypothetical protein